MLYYFIPILLSFIYSLSKVKISNDITKSLVVENGVVLIAAFIFCSGYMTGSDWMYYEPLYNGATLDNFYSYEKEKGFYLLMLLFKSLGFTFFVFLIILKFIVFYIIVAFLKRHYKKYLLPFSIFLSTNALFIFVDNPLRYMLALGIVTFSFNFLLERKLLKFSICIIIATYFHISCILIFGAYFLRFENFSRVKLGISYLLLIVFWTPTSIIYVLENFAPILLNYIDWYYQQFLTNQNDYYFTIGWFFNQGLFILVLAFRKEILASSTHGKFFYSMSVFYFFLSASFSLIPTFFRVPIYLAVFLYISLAIIINRYSKPALRYGIVAYIIIAAIKNLYTTYVYLPYSNYFVHAIFLEEKPYEERIKYNKNEYLKRTGELPPDSFRPDE